MAVMSDADRADATRIYVNQIYVRTNDRADYDTDLLREVIDAMDNYLNANQAAINAVLPEPFKSTASLEQKGLALAVTASKRTGVV